MKVMNNMMVKMRMEKMMMKMKKMKKIKSIKKVDPNKNQSRKLKERPIQLKSLNANNNDLIM